MSFHQRCGSRIHLSNLNHTARRNINDFNHGIVLSSEPMVDEVWFQVRIDEKVCFAQMSDVVVFFPSLASVALFSIRCFILDTSMEWNYGNRCYMYESRNN